jgi:hypothetical protein
VAGTFYRSLSPAVEVHAATQTRHPVAESRRVVLELAALFSVDSFGGGFVVDSLLVLWLYRRFALEEQTAATVFFVAATLSAFSRSCRPKRGSPDRPHSDDGLHAPAGETAASSVTNVPRSLAAALAPLMAGALLEKATFGCPW